MTPTEENCEKEARGWRDSPKVSEEEELPGPWNYNPELLISTRPHNGPIQNKRDFYNSHTENPEARL